MNAARLIEQVRAAGGQIEARGATIKLRAPQPLPDALIAELRRHKPELLAHLGVAESVRFDLEERAAIREYSGGQTRPDAERGAIADVERRYAYRFRLHGHGGGTYLSPAATLDEARTELIGRYGERLALICKIKAG